MKHLFLMIVSITLCRSTLCADRETLSEEAKNARKDQDIGYAIILDFNNKNITDKNIAKILDRASRLEELSVQNHNLQKPNLFSNTLHTLDVSHGSLQSFALLSYLIRMPALRTLNISHNKITTLSSPNQQNLLFSTRQYFLFDLDVSHNKLTVLDMQLLDRLDILNKIDFSHNPITKVNHVESDCSCTDITMRSRLLPATVTIHNTQLSPEDQQLLQAMYSKPQEEAVYKLCKRMSGICGLVTTTFLSPTVVFPFAEIVRTNTSLIAIPLILGPLILISGYPLGTGIYACRTPDNEKYITNFVFNFGDEASDATARLEPDNEV